jgi:hypothetical protein
MSTESDILTAATVAIPIATQLVQIGADALSGQASTEQTVRRLVHAGLDLVPAETLREYLTDAARARGELLADAAELAKFGTGQEK